MEIVVIEFFNLKAESLQEKYIYHHMLMELVRQVLPFMSDEVTNFFSPHAQSKSTAVAIGIGVSSYISKAGKIYAGKLNKEDLLRI